MNDRVLVEPRAGGERPASAAPAAAWRWVKGRTEVRPPVYRAHQYRVVLAFVIVVAILGPKIGGMSRSNQYLVDVWLMYSVTAIGFYWVFGLAGRFAFTQTFMMSLGGYMSAWVTMGGSNGRPVILGLLAAVAVTAVLAAVVGLLLRKAHALYFGIGTLAVTQIGIYVFSRWTQFAGPSGTRVGLPPIELFGKEFIKDGSVFWLFLGVLAGVLVLSMFLERSPLRREAVAARENRGVAVLAGVPSAKHQLVLFMLGSAIGGLAGAFFAHWGGVISADEFGIDLGIGLFLMLILGGMHSVWGPVLGAAFYVALPEFLKSISTYQRIVYGCILLVVIMALPMGIVGLAQNIWGWAKRARGLGSRHAAAGPAAAAATAGIAPDDPGGPAATGAPSSDAPAAGSSNGSTPAGQSEAVADAES